MKLLCRQEITEGEALPLAWVTSAWLKIPRYRVEIFLITFPLIHGPAVGPGLTIRLDTSRIIRFGIRVVYRPFAIPIWNLRRVILLPRWFNVVRIRHATDLGVSYE